MHPSPWYDTPVLALRGAGVARFPTGVVAEVAVAPFAVERDSGGVLRAVADTCLERLVRELTAEGVRVARFPELSEKYHAHGERSVVGPTHEHHLPRAAEPHPVRTRPERTRAGSGEPAPAGLPHRYREAP
jgi:hypothetical protein